MSKEEERFWAKVSFSNGCWEWFAGKYNTGYGTFRVSGKSLLSHRVSWSLWFGPIPDGLNVLHRCDNPPCVRPDHLFLGTHKDNSQDMARKGRAAGKVQPGETHPNSKLSDADVLDIRARHACGETQVSLGKRFGVRQTTVSRIVLRQAWTHI